jgi:hypothetical protein
MIFIAILIGFIGAYVLIWVFNVYRLATAQRPGFFRTKWFQWVVPLSGLIFLVIGFGWALARSLFWGTLSFALMLGLAILLIRYDRFSASIKILYADYLRLKRETPGATDFELLFSIVKSRKPGWTEDRVIEMCVGKDIKQLVLLLLLVDKQIHPLNDMQLYERLKRQVEKLAPKA